MIVRKCGCDGGGARVRAPGYRSVLQPLSGTAPGLAHEKTHADQGVMEMLLLHENSLPACVRLTTHKTSMNMGLVKTDSALFPFYVAGSAGMLWRRCGRFHGSPAKGTFWLRNEHFLVLAEESSTLDRVAASWSCVRDIHIRNLTICLIHRIIIRGACLSALIAYPAHVVIRFTIAISGLLNEQLYRGKTRPHLHFVRKKSPLARPLVPPADNRYRKTIC